MRVDRRTVDLSEYPDLIVVYLGMRVRKPRGLLTLLGIGPQIRKSWQEQPDGLLLHEDLIWSLSPPHAGMRQYWRDLRRHEPRGGPGQVRAEHAGSRPDVLLPPACRTVRRNGRPAGDRRG